MPDDLLPLAIIGLDRGKREFVLRSDLGGRVTGFLVQEAADTTPAEPDWQSAPQGCGETIALETPLRLGLRLDCGDTLWAEARADALEDCTANRLSISRATFDPLRRQLRIVGWLTTALEKYRMDIYAAGLPLGTVRKAMSRPDVKASNSFLPLRSGFAGEVKVPDALVPGLIAGEVQVEARLIARASVASLRPVEMAPLSDPDKILAQARLSQRIEAHIDALPRTRLEKLIASEAFRRRWSTPKPGAAWVAREQIVARLISLLNPGDEIAVRLRNGDLVLCQPVDDSILARKFLIDAGDEMGFLDRLSGQVGSGDQVLDVGAAYGMVSRAMARAGALVTAVEADPTSASRIRRMGVSFGAGKINLIEKAIAEKSGEIVFAGMGESCVGSGKILENDDPETIEAFLDEVSHLRQMPLSAQHVPGSYDRRRFTRADVSIRKVPAASIDDICREGALQDVKLLKIDIEGGELMALRGAQGLLDGSFGTPPIVVFEYSRLFPMRGGRHEEILDIFFRRGWELFVLADGKTKGGKLTPIPDVRSAPHHDNLIAVPPGVQPHLG